jgi:hypothetical protein
MKRMAALAVLALAIAGPVVGQETTDKVGLRYRFAEGEQLKVFLKYSMSVKLEEVPEAFQGFMSDDPIDMDFQGLLGVEVKGVAEDGKAKIEGKWNTLKVKGTVMMTEIDFDYDAERDAGKKPEKKDPQDEDPGFGPFADMEDRLREMAEKPMSGEIDARGRLSIKGAQDDAFGPLGVSSKSLNGLMGPFPKDDVGRGDTWKEEQTLSLPGGMGGALDLTIRSENTYETDEALGEQTCAVIRSKFSVETNQPEGDENQPLRIKLKTSGEGDGKTYFAVREGRAPKGTSNLKINVEATIEDPNGGGDIEIKAALKIDQSLELRK